MFGGNPKNIDRPQPGFNCEIGRRYFMEISIKETKAEYSIDGQIYARCYYDHTDRVARGEGYFGFAINSLKEDRVIDSV